MMVRSTLFIQRNPARKPYAENTDHPAQQYGGHHDNRSNSDLFMQ